MYICYDCGRLVREDERKEVSLPAGEFWGAPAYETWSVCPHCGSEDLREVEEDDENEI